MGCRQAFSFGIKYYALAVAFAAVFDDRGNKCASDAAISKCRPNIKAFNDGGGVVLPRNGDAAGSGVIHERDECGVRLAVLLAYKCQIRRAAMPQCNGKAALVFYKQFKKLNEVGAPSNLTDRGHLEFSPARSSNQSRTC